MLLGEEPLSALQGEREGPTPQAWEGEVGAGKRSGIPHLTPTLSAPGGERERLFCLPGIDKKCARLRAQEGGQETAAGPWALDARSRTELSGKIEGQSM
jgi:hypothetical protein